MELGRYRLSARIREIIVRGLPVYVFLAAYIGLTVFGNVLYLTMGPQLGNWSRDGATIKVISDAGFWALLFLPVAICPLAFWTARLSEPVAEAVFPLIPEIPRSVYAVLAAALFVYVVTALADAQAFSRLASPTNAIEAVRNRFALLSELGFIPQLAMKSLLVFLAVYAAARAACERGRFWPIAATIHSVALIACLVLLNMKWPAVLFILLLGISAFVFSRKWPFTTSLVVTAAGLLFYLLISVFVLRSFPADQPKTTSIARKAATSAVQSSPRLFAIAFNRMAVAAPYYYDIKSFAAPDCDPDLSHLWIKRSIECEPSLIVYERIFGDDGFAGIGTSPAAANLYGYALAGWPGAIISSVFVATVLGLFLPFAGHARTRPILGTILIMGAYAGYFFSQLPIEGAMIYDHGVLWWALMVLALMALFPARQRIALGQP